MFGKKEGACKIPGNVFILLLLLFSTDSQDTVKTGRFPGLSPPNLLESTHKCECGSSLAFVRGIKCDSIYSPHSDGEVCVRPCVRESCHTGSNMGICM